VLVAGGADIHATSNDNDSCIDVASRNGHHDVVEYLSSAKAIGLSIQHQIWRRRRLWSLMAFYRRPTTSSTSSTLTCVSSSSGLEPLCRDCDSTQQQLDEALEVNETLRTEVLQQLRAELQRQDLDNDNTMITRGLRFLGLFRQIHSALRDCNSTQQQLDEAVEVNETLRTEVEQLRADLEQQELDNYNMMIPRGLRFLGLFRQVHSAVPPSHSQLIIETGMLPPHLQEQIDEVLLDLSAYSEQQARDGRTVVFPATVEDASGASIREDIRRAWFIPLAGTVTSQYASGGRVSTRDVPPRSVFFRGILAYAKRWL